MVQQDLNLITEGFQDATFLGEDQPVKGVEVIRMNWKEPHVFIQALVHPVIARGEGSEIVPDASLLIDGLFQQPLGDHETDILAHDGNLAETILDPPQAVGDVLEAAAIEYRLLDAGDETEAQVLAHLTDLAQE